MMYVTKRWFEPLQYDLVREDDDYSQIIDMLAHKKFVPVDNIGIGERGSNLLVGDGVLNLEDFMEQSTMDFARICEGHVLTGQAFVVACEGWFRDEERFQKEIVLMRQRYVATFGGKVLWTSRHELSPAQVSAIRSLHGEDAEVVKDPVVFSNADGLADYVRNHPEAFVYAVAGAPHYIAASLAGLPFGVFENHPQRRDNGGFGLAAVYHVDGGLLEKVWHNPDPMSDEGEALIPVR